MNTFQIQGGQDVNTTSFSLCQYPGTSWFLGTECGQQLSVSLLKKRYGSLSVESF